MNKKIKNEKTDENSNLIRLIEKSSISRLLRKLKMIKGHLHSDELNLS